MNIKKLYNAARDKEMDAQRLRLAADILSLERGHTVIVVAPKSGHVVAPITLPDGIADELHQNLLNWANDVAEKES